MYKILAIFIYCFLFFACKKQETINNCPKLGFRYEYPGAVYYNISDTNAIVEKGKVITFDLIIPSKFYNSFYKENIFTDAPKVLSNLGTNVYINNNITYGADSLNINILKGFRTKDTLNRITPIDQFWAYKDTDTTYKLSFEFKAKYSGIYHIQPTRFVGENKNCSVSLYECKPSHQNRHLELIYNNFNIQYNPNSNLENYAYVFKVM